MMISRQREDNRNLSGERRYAVVVSNQIPHYCFFRPFCSFNFEMYLYIEALSLRAYIRLTRHDLSVFKMTCCLAMPVICLLVDAHPASECVRIFTPRRKQN